jgi:hypothetical protein
MSKVRKEIWGLSPGAGATRMFSIKSGDAVVSNTLR